MRSLGCTSSDVLVPKEKKVRTVSLLFHPLLTLYVSCSDLFASFFFSPPAFLSSSLTPRVDTHTHTVLWARYKAGASLLFFFCPFPLCSQFLLLTVSLGRILICERRSLYPPYNNNTNSFVL